MAVGEGTLNAALSYLAVGRETSLNGGGTATAALDFLSGAPLKITKEGKILEQLQRNRSYSKHLSLGKKIEGDLEYYADASASAPNFIMHNAFGSIPISATATGETSGGAFTHTLNIGTMEVSYTSLHINMRKGEAAGQVYEYNGVRVGEWGIVAELDEAVKTVVSLMAIDATLTSNDVESGLAFETTSALSFVNGRVSIETTFAALTTTSFWHVQTVSFKLINNLKGDNDSRRIGSDVLGVLPVGVTGFELTLGLRFDTTTALDAMLGGTQLSAELEFLGDTLTGSAIREGIKISLPKIFVNDAGDPEIGGPDEQLKAEVSFNVLRDDSSATGFAVRAEVTNLVSSYA